MDEISKQQYLAGLRQYQSLAQMLPEFLHDLRNRTGAILIGASLLKEHPDKPLSPEDYFQSVDWIERYARDIANMIDAVQEYSQS
jgi:hypothetical protein